MKRNDLLLGSALAGALLVGGCADLDGMKAESARLAALVDDGADRIEQLDATLVQVDRSIWTVRSELAGLELSAEDRVEAEAKLDELAGALEELREARADASAVVEGWRAGIRAIDVELQAAGTSGEALGAMVKAGGLALAPSAGPYAPFVLIGSNALAAILAGLGASKVSRDRTARRIVLPIEAARVRKYELPSNVPEEDRGGSIYLDRAVVTAGHAANGVDKLIRRVTG